MIFSNDLKIKRLLTIAENIALSRASVLICGESGTGKELFARFIHAKSHRATHPFVAINCAAVPENLLESELFGFEKGTFTGAEQRRVGKFELAQNSTFLLDEISEIPLTLQAKLLRVLQESEVERLGGSAPIKINVRVIATTNRDLQTEVKQGRFREDLFYRLNVIPLKIPPLRERLGDIEGLAQRFVIATCEENGLSQKSLSTEAIERLKSAAWPGNVRELKNVIERSVLLHAGDLLRSPDILMSENFELVPSDERILKAGMTVEQAERFLIVKTLEHTNQNRTQAAKLLGISVRTLRNKLHEYNEVKL
jgi:two-component system response regulator FlrC